MKKLLVSGPTKKIQGFSLGASEIFCVLKGCKPLQNLILRAINYSKSKD